MRILILEDDPLTALDLQLLLEACGHEVIGICETLAEARTCIGDGLDFAFLDIDLPDGKSFPIAERLEAGHIPFAFVSASARSELPAGLRHAPFIAKPYQHATIRMSLPPEELRAAC